MEKFYESLRGTSLEQKSARNGKSCLYQLINIRLRVPLLDADSLLLEEIKQSKRTAGTAMTNKVL